MNWRKLIAGTVLAGALFALSGAPSNAISFNPPPPPPPVTIVCGPGGSASGASGNCTGGSGGGGGLVISPIVQPPRGTR
jgi:hypothetical protein